MLVDSNYEIILCEHCSGYGYYYVNLEKNQCRKCEGKGRLFKTTTTTKLIEGKESTYIDNNIITNLYSTIESQIATDNISNMHKLKLKTISKINFGNQVIISGKDKYIGKGYITTIPSFEVSIMKRGIVHLPLHEPEWKEWYTLQELLNNPNVTQIEII